MQYARGMKKSDGTAHFDSERKRQQEINAGLMSADGEENPFLLWREFGELNDQGLHGPALQQKPCSD